MKIFDRGFYWLCAVVCALYGLIAFVEFIEDAILSGIRLGGDASVHFFYLAICVLAIKLIFEKLHK